jgi:hypothetical protein
MPAGTVWVILEEWQGDAATEGAAQLGGVYSSQASAERERERLIELYRGPNFNRRSLDEDEDDWDFDITIEERPILD